MFAFAAWSKFSKVQLVGLSAEPGIAGGDSCSRQPSDCDCALPEKHCDGPATSFQRAIYTHLRNRPSLKNTAPSKTICRSNTKLCKTWPTGCPTHSE